MNECPECTDWFIRVCAHFNGHRVTLADWHYDPSRLGKELVRLGKRYDVWASFGGYGGFGSCWYVGNDYDEAQAAFDAACKDMILDHALYIGM